MYEEEVEEKKIQDTPENASKYWQYASEKATTTKIIIKEAGKKEENKKKTKRPKTSACPSIRSNHSNREIFSFFSVK